LILASRCISAGSNRIVPATGVYKHGFPPTEKNLKLKISRADVAGFMLQQLSGDAYLRRSASLSY